LELDRRPFPALRLATLLDEGKPLFEKSLEKVQIEVVTHVSSPPVVISPFAPRATFLYDLISALHDLTGFRALPSSMHETPRSPALETASQVELHRHEGVLIVEAEASKVRPSEVASLLHVTNAMAMTEDDFHKGLTAIHEKVMTFSWPRFETCSRTMKRFRKTLSG
jgi:hypothetical protein